MVDDNVVEFSRKRRCVHTGYRKRAMAHCCNKQTPLCCQVANLKSDGRRKIYLGKNDDRNTPSIERMRVSSRSKRTSRGPLTVGFWMPQQRKTKSEHNRHRALPWRSTQKATEMIVRCLGVGYQKQVRTFRAAD